MLLKIVMCLCDSIHKTEVCDFKPFFFIQYIHEYVGMEVTSSGIGMVVEYVSE